MGSLVAAEGCVQTDGSNITVFQVGLTEPPATTAPIGNPLAGYRVPVMADRRLRVRPGEVLLELAGERIVRAQDHRGRQISLSMRQVRKLPGVDPDDLEDLAGGTRLVARNGGLRWPREDGQLALAYGLSEHARFVLPHSAHIVDSEQRSVFTGSAEKRVAYEWARDMSLQSLDLPPLYFLTHEDGPLLVDIAALPRLAWQNPNASRILEILKKLGVSNLRKVKTRLVGDLGRRARLVEFEVGHAPRLRAMGSLAYQIDEGRGTEAREAKLPAELVRLANQGQLDLALALAIQDVILARPGRQLGTTWDVAWDEREVSLRIRGLWPEGRGCAALVWVEDGPDLLHVGVIDLVTPVGAPEADTLGLAEHFLGITVMDLFAERWALRDAGTLEEKMGPGVRSSLKEVVDVLQELGKALADRARPSHWTPRSPSKKISPKIKPDTIGTYNRRGPMAVPNQRQLSLTALVKEAHRAHKGELAEIQGCALVAIEENLNLPEGQDGSFSGGELLVALQAAGVEQVVQREILAPLLEVLSARLERQPNLQVVVNWDETLS